MIYFLALVTRIVFLFPGVKRERERGKKGEKKVIFIYLALGSFRQKLQSDRKKGRKHKTHREKPENVFIFSERNFFFLLSSIFLFFGENFFVVFCVGTNTLFIIY